MNIYESITGIMQEGYAITKEKRNQQQGFLYRGIDDVMNTFQPLMSKYRIFCVPEVLGREREERKTNKGTILIYSILTIRYTFFAEDGTSVSAVVVGEGMDSGDKASNKAMAVGMKYAMFQVFCIPTEETPDPDAETPPRSSAAAPQASAAPPPSSYSDGGHSYQEPPLFRCTDCGNVISPWTKGTITVMSVREIAQNSEKEYGRRLCLNCIAKAKQAAMAAQNENPG